MDLSHVDRLNRWGFFYLFLHFFKNVICFIWIWLIWMPIYFTILYLSPFYLISLNLMTYSETLSVIFAHIQYEVFFWILYFNFELSEKIDRNWNINQIKINFWRTLIKQMNNFFRSMPIIYWYHLLISHTYQHDTWSI